MAIEELKKLNNKFMRREPSDFNLRSLVGMMESPKTNGQKIKKKVLKNVSVIQSLKLFVGLIFSFLCDYISECSVSISTCLALFYTRRQLVFCSEL